MHDTTERTSTHSPSHLRMAARPWRSDEDWTRIRGNWRQIVERVRARRCTLTSDDLSMIKGRREEFAEIIHKTFGLTREQTEEAIRELCDPYADPLEDESGDSQRPCPEGDAG